MIKYMLLALALFSCTQAQVDKANDKIDAVTAAVECRAKVLKPYKNLFTTDQVADALVGKLDPVEVLQAVEVVAADVALVKEAFALCSE